MRHSARRLCSLARQPLLNPAPTDPTLVDRQSRLELYRAGQLYHVQKYDPHFEMTVNG